MAKLTDAHVEEFKKHLREWQVKLGLQDWRIVVSPIPAKGSMAEMDKWMWEQRQVTCRIGRDWLSSPVNSCSLAQTAVHELLHVLLYELMAVAADPAKGPEDVRSVEHRVINVLEQLLVPCAES